MKWFWARRHPNGADEARTAASDSLAAVRERTDEVARVTSAAELQAARSRRYLAELEAIYHLGRRRGVT